MTLGDLTADAANPREIADEAAAGLGHSLAAFGDLAGIVFNRRTGELVCGHQRVEQLQALETPEEPARIETIDEARETGRLVVRGQAYAIRVVDWSREKQRAANLAANNLRIQGTFTGELESYLLPVKGELDAELWDDVGLGLLLAPPTELLPPESWTVVVDCDSEAEQQKLYEELRGRGYEVKLVTM